MISRLIIDNLALIRGERRLFSGLSFTVAAGQAVALTGPNGAGKTSLLRAIAGLLSPEAGTITFAGQDGAPLDADDARAGGLHLLGHHDGLKSARTAREELEFWSRWMGGGADAAARAIATFELEPLLGLDVRKLSAGQRRRLALARLVAAPRRLWLLDEPMAPLDAARRESFGAMMKAHLEQGGLILAAVHDPLPLPTTALALDEAMA